MIGPGEAMREKSHEKLLARLVEAYRRRSPVSARLQQEAGRCLVDGGSHTLRLIDPFPPRISSARGAYINDEDGHRILDFWQGHHANILGHNPPQISSALEEAFRRNWGLQTGFCDRVQTEVAELLCRGTGAEKVRFTTGGTLATMYAVQLALAFTGREQVLKIAGGWHGAQPWCLKGVAYHDDPPRGYSSTDSAGLPPSLEHQVLLTRFNDPEDLVRCFARHGDRLAGFIVEPFIGAGGYLPASSEYLQTARKLTEKHGTVLIFDEVISGFRFRAGSAAGLYGLSPDLSTFGKIVGGGMPVSAVAGRSDILTLAAKQGKVNFSGGTYSGHPATMLAARTMLSKLIAEEDEIYPRLNRLGELARRTVESAFRQEGIYACCPRLPQDQHPLPPGSLSMLVFPRREGHCPSTPEEIHDPEVCDVTLGNRIVHLALLLEDVHVMHGLGSLSSAHTEEDILRLDAACRRAARSLRAGLS
jgi:glutamate-1-semialdehyde 2,1-aminomutase